MKTNHETLCCVASAALVAVAVAAATSALRFGVIESGGLPHDCTAVDASAALCALKTALIESFLQQRLGWVSLAFGVFAFAWSARRLAWLAWVLGVAGLVLYSYDPAAVGALLALLVLLRPVQQGRSGQDEPAQQPGERLRIGGLR